MEKMVRKAVPLQSMEQISTCSLWSTPHQSKWISKEDCDPVESLHWTSSRTCGPARKGIQAGAGLLAGHVTPWGDPHWSSLFLKEHIPWKEPMLEHFLKNISPWEGLTLEKSVGEGPHTKAEEGKEFSPDEEWVAETMCHELTTVLTPKPLWVDVVENLEVKPG